MTFRTAYELLLIGFSLLIAYKLIVKPVYSLFTGRSLEFGKDTTPRDKLREAQDTVVTETILSEAEQHLRVADAIRNQRHTNGK